MDGIIIVDRECLEDNKISVLYMNEKLGQMLDLGEVALHNETTDD